MDPDWNFHSRDAVFVFVVMSTFVLRPFSSTTTFWKAGTQASYENDIRNLYACAQLPTFATPSTGRCHNERFHRMTKYDAQPKSNGTIRGLSLNTKMER